MKARNKILVVDDLEMDRAMMVKIFKDEYLVSTAGNGKEAMEILLNDDVDIVLLDLSLPVMDGYEVIAAMKADQRLAAVLIMVITGAAGESECRAFDLGADDFIAKPCNPYVVKKRVRNLIDKYVLQTEELKQALEKEKQRNKADAAFLLRVSHEMRASIHSVISTAERIKEEPENRQKIIECSEKISSSAQYLLGVMNDMLDMSALEQQKIVIRRSPFDLKKLMEDTAGMFYGQCKEKNIHLHMNFEDFTEKYLFGDPVHFKEILVNLISNAVEFTKADGNVMIRVSQVSKIDSVVNLRIEVTEPFVQENDNTENVYGAGLELPFTVVKETPAISSEKLKKVRALFIDDDVEALEYGKQVLGRFGIQCDIARDGKDALLKMRMQYEKGQGYDICFTDWKLPGMNGIEITKAIREIFNDDTMIVVASDYDVTELRQEAAVAGANLVVSKPMFQSAVFNLLMNITGGQYQKDSAERVKYHFDGKRILVAEDNTLNAEMVMKLVNMAGFKTERAEDGQKVCEKFIKSKPGTYDAILMDIQMPFMNGYEATKYIRKSKHKQALTIPIIAVTANAFTEDVRACLASGMNGHIAKPVDSERLYRTLDKLVGQSK